MSVTHKFAYPDDNTVLIGFFMVDVNQQGKGFGTNIIKDALSFIKL